jgi:hypothetical protein
MGGDFRIGDRVYIAESSAFRGQCSVAGTITRKTTYALPWHVDFDNGYGNDYGKIDLAHDTDINVGDRIRVTTNYWGVDYPVGSIQEVRHVWDTGNGRPYELATGKWCNGFKVSNDTPLTKDNIKGEGDKEMDKEQVTRNGYVYTKLKSLSPESVLKGGPCRDEFDNYVNEADGFYTDQNFGNLLRMCDDYPDWLPWLISHGYIGKEEVKKEKVKKVAVFKEHYVEKLSNGTFHITGFPAESGQYRYYSDIPEGVKFTMTLEWEE